MAVKGTRDSLSQRASKPRATLLLPQNVFGFLYLLGNTPQKARQVDAFVYLEVDRGGVNIGDKPVQDKLYRDCTEARIPTSDSHFLTLV